MDRSCNVFFKNEEDAGLAPNATEDGFEFNTDNQNQSSGFNFWSQVSYPCYYMKKYTPLKRIGIVKHFIKKIKINVLAFYWMRNLSMSPHVRQLVGWSACMS